MKGDRIMAHDIKPRTPKGICDSVLHVKEITIDIFSPKKDSIIKEMPKK